MPRSTPALAAAAAMASSLLLSASAQQPFVLQPQSALYIDASVALNGPINAAIRDIQRDWYKVIGTTLVVVPPITVWNGGCVVSLYQDNSTLAPESFLVQAGNASGIYPELRITGADMRGLIYGLYHFSSDFLGVDPFWFFYDLQPAFAGVVDVPADYEYFSGAPAFTNRGAFFNDEDLTAYFFQDPLGGAVYDTQAANYYAETVLRVRMNTVIPSTFGFADETHYKVYRSRGLKFGNHHVMPVNTNVFAWPKGVSYSYRLNPQSFHAVWSELINYQQNVDGREMVYSVGLRGVNDEPYWNEDTLCASVECAGAVISAAIANQTLIARSTPTANGQPPQLVSYLWMELLPLLDAGTLTFPPGVRIILTDFPGSFNFDVSNVTSNWGLYAHLQMMNGEAGQLVEFIPLRRAFNALWSFWDKQATGYAMINLSDLRPVPLGVEAVYRYLWDPTAFNSTAALGAMRAGGGERKSGGRRKGRRGPVNWWPSAQNPATWGGKEAMKAALSVALAGTVTPTEAMEAFHLEFATRHFGSATNASLPQAVADMYTAYFNISYMAPDGITTKADHYLGNTIRSLLGPFEDAVDSGTRPASLASTAQGLLSFANDNLPFVSDLFLNQVLPTAAYIPPGQPSAFYAAHLVAQTAIHYCHLVAFQRTALGALAWVAGDKDGALANVTLALGAMDELLMYLREGEGQGIWRGLFAWDRWTWTTGSRATLAHLGLHIQGLHGPPAGPDPYPDYDFMLYEGTPNSPTGPASQAFPFSNFNQSQTMLDVAVRVYCQEDAPAPYGLGRKATAKATADPAASSCSTNWVGATFSGDSANLVLFVVPHPLRTPFAAPTIRYTLDGTSPGPSSPVYTAGTPVVVTGNATLIARAFEAGTGNPLAFDNAAIIIQH